MVVRATDDVHGGVVDVDVVDVCDPEFWKFWIVPTQTLNDRMGPREKIGLRKLRDFVPLGPVKLSEIRTEVD